MDNNENKIGIRKLPKDYGKNGVDYEQHYFDTIEEAQNFVDNDWNGDYRICYLISKPKDTWYYGFYPTKFSFSEREKHFVTKIYEDCFGRRKEIVHYIP